MTELSATTQGVTPARALRRALEAAWRARTDAVLQLETWADRRRQRRHLQGLDRRLLADIGLDPADVAREVSKPFWQG